MSQGFLRWQDKNLSPSEIASLKKTAQMQSLKPGDAYNILSEDTKPEMKKAKSVQKRMPTRGKFGLA